MIDIIKEVKEDAQMLYTKKDVIELLEKMREQLITKPENKTRRFRIQAGNKFVTLESDHTIDEWRSRFVNLPGAISISTSDMLGGIVCPDENMVYWCIDGRFYETDIFLNN